MQNQQLPVAIIGGGPVGLGAAAHLVKRGMSFILFEKGESVGASLLEWGHVRMFSPWEFNVDKAAAELLSAHGWQSPPKQSLPTGGELVQYYLAPLSNLPELKPFIHTSSEVISITRKDLDKVKTAGRDQVPFVISYRSNNENLVIEASAVLDATGTWGHPNPIGANGVYAGNEENLASYIYYGIPDGIGKEKARYANKSVAVVGSGHSAINSILELDRLPGTQITWILRKEAVADTFGGGTEDALPARGELGLKIKGLVEEGKLKVVAPFRIKELQQVKGKLRIIGTQDGNPSILEDIDEIVANTGARPDFAMLREIRHYFDSSLECVPELAELIDPNVHSCGTVRPHGEAELKQPENNFYVVGAKSYGRAPTFLMATGYEQVRSVVAALVGDMEAARKVELNLPETGVCSVTIPSKSVDCCGTNTLNTTISRTSCCSG